MVVEIADSHAFEIGVFRIAFALAFADLLRAYLALLRCHGNPSKAIVDGGNRLVQLDRDFLECCARHSHGFYRFVLFLCPDYYRSTIHIPLLSYAWLF